MDSLGRVDVLKVGTGVQPRELDPDIVALGPVVALTVFELRRLGTVSRAKPSARAGRVQLMESYAKEGALSQRERDDDERKGRTRSAR